MAERGKYGLKAFRQAVEEFIRTCEQDPDLLPDDYTFCRFTGVPRQTLERYRTALRRHRAADGDGDAETAEAAETTETAETAEAADGVKRRRGRPGRASRASYDPALAFGRALETLAEYRAHWYCRRALDNPRLTTFCALALRQPENGGWQDRAAGSGKAAPGGTVIRVQFSGGGEDPFG